LSNLVAGLDEVLAKGKEEAAAAVDVELRVVVGDDTVFGGPKNDVMLPSVLGFLLASAAPTSPLRLSEDMARLCVLLYR
jgi:hypothetical protein